VSNCKKLQLACNTYVGGNAVESTTEADSNDMKSSWDYRPIGMFGFF